MWAFEYLYVTPWIKNAVSKISLVEVHALRCSSYFLKCMQKPSVLEGYPVVSK